MAKKAAVRQSRNQLSASSANDMTRPLPDECIMHVFSFLDDVADRRSCASVCRRWLHLQAMAVPVGPKASLDLSLALPGTVSPSVKSPSRSASSASPKAVARSIDGEQATNARLLAMAVNVQSRGGLSALSIRCAPRLAAQRQVAHSGMLALARVSPFLKTLTLVGCINVDDETLAVVARHCPLLSKVHLQSCPRITDRGLLALAACAQELQHVALAACPAVSNAGVQALTDRCAKLVTISLVDLPKVNAHCLTSLGAQCPRVARLKVGGCANFFGDGSLPFPAACPSLRMLTLCRQAHLSTLSLASVTSAFPSLEALHLTACPRVTDAALLAVADGCGYLRHLSLDSCPALTLGGVQKLLVTASELRTCTLERLGGGSSKAEGCGTVRDRADDTADTASSSNSGQYAAAVLNIQMALRLGCVSRLKKFHVGSCDPSAACIWIDTVAALCPPSSSLEWLEISSMPGLDPSCIMRILGQCGRTLTTVVLSSLPDVDDAVAAALAQACGQNLETLSIDGCPRLGDRGVNAIAQGCVGLWEVDISSCGVTDEEAVRELQGRARQRKEGHKRRLDGGADVAHLAVEGKGETAAAAVAPMAGLVTASTTMSLAPSTALSVTPDIFAPTSAAVIGPAPGSGLTGTSSHFHPMLSQHSRSLPTLALPPTSTTLPIQLGFDSLAGVLQPGCAQPLLQTMSDTSLQTAVHPGNQFNLYRPVATTLPGGFIFGAGGLGTTQPPSGFGLKSTVDLLSSQRCTPPIGSHQS